MTVNITAMQPGFVGEVTGIEFCRPITPDEVVAIERGMDDYAVLTFPDQPMTDDQQVVFSGNFGELEIPLAAQMAKPEMRRFQKLELAGISNFAGKDTEELRARDDSRRMYALANRLWHSDASFRAVGPATRCCMRALSRPGAAIRNSPICGRRMTHWTRPQRLRSRT